ncbi:hypothetical protein [Brachybacterium sp. Marseille-Q7125]|uniref:DUF7937 domain-containing protein n=1 Tax=Brachybacterium sp. Marseille-Q7125 TaxID=2932815 RepID=UPI001FF61A1F|nr:hypothetical protein [Brachybacterium sp. Marseille-Q7125]
MDSHPRPDRGRDADWIFAVDDPHSMPTETLPDPAEFESYASQLLARRGARPALPPAPETHQEQDAQPDTHTDQIPVITDPSAPLERVPTAEPDPDAPSASGAHPVSYARSGTTPNAEDEDGSAIGGFQMPERFKDLGLFDALRDLLALVSFAAALTTTFTVAEVPVLELAGKLAIGVGIAAILIVHALRWIPDHPPLGLIRVLRIGGMLPALLVPAAALVADLVTSLPLLFASLPDGPPVGIGVGVSLVLLGGIVGFEPRAHGGYLPRPRALRASRTVLLVIAGAAAVWALLALVMIIGRLFTTGWGYSLMTFAHTMISVLLLGIVLVSGLRRERTWYVFSAAAVAGLVILSLADSTLGLHFAAPGSAASSFVWLPFLFAAFGVMISRSFVRSMPVSFRRTDWLVFTVRAFEFSILMHGAAMLWHLIAAIVALGPSGQAPGGPVIHLIDAVVCVCFVVVSLFGRSALLTRPAVSARASGVVAGLVLTVIGFLAVIVNSLAMAIGAGLVTGGLALVLGIAVGLMLTVPAPVRDEFGAPDLTRMFADFRARDTGRISLLDQVPDVREETARQKVFPTS